MNVYVSAVACYPIAHSTSHSISIAIIIIIPFFNI